MKKKIIENLKTIFYALILALIIRSFLFQPFYIPSSSMEPTLLVGDRNAIIIAARISGYGADYDTNVSCPACTATSNFTFDLNQTRIHECKIDESWGLTKTEEGYFKTSLPLDHLLGYNSL